MGQVFLFKASWALVTAGPAATRRPGSTLTPEECELAQLPPDRQVYTLAVFARDGVHPVERLEVTLARWESEGRLAP